MAYNFGNGIKVTSGFDLATKGPLDNRTVVDTLAQRDAHITSGRGYEGLKVYVCDEKKEYIYTGAGWFESGGMTDEQATQLLEAYTHSRTEHASAETLDELIIKVDSLPTIESLNSIIETKAPLDHTHEDIYYNKEEVDQRIVDIVTDGQIDLSNYATVSDLAKKAEADHTHVLSEVRELEDILNNKADKEDTASLEDLELKAPLDHTHTVSEIDNLQNMLDLKANLAAVYNRTELNVKFADINTALAKKAAIEHDHDDYYYSKEIMDEKLANILTDGELSLENYVTKSELVGDLAKKAEASHTHNTEEIVGIEDLIPDTYSKNEIDGMVLSAKTEAMGHADNLASEIVGEVSDKYNTLSKVEQAFTELTEGSTSSIKDLDVAIESKSPIGHDHDDRYYDKVTVENMIETGISGANLEQYVTKSLLTEELAKKPDHDHTHTISDIKELDTEIDTRIETATTELNNTINASLETKAPIVHDHNDMYYTKEVVDERIQAGVGSIDLEVLVTKSELVEGLATKAEAGHTHKVLEIEGLQDELNKKADIENTVSKSDFNTAMETKADLVHTHDGVHAPAVHDHSDIYYNKEEIEALLDQNAGNVSHDTLQAAYKYTDERVSDVIGQENELGITTIQGTVEALITHKNEFNEYKTSIDTTLENKAPLVHAHGVADINGLEEELDSKLSKEDFTSSNKDLTDYVDNKIQEAKTYTDTSISEVIGVENDKKITSIKEMVDLFIEHETEFKEFQTATNTALENKASADHHHDDAYAPKEHEHDLEDLNISESFYDKTEINNLLKDYSPLVHGHVIADIDKLQEELDSKAISTDVDKKFNDTITDIENDYREAIEQAISALVDGAPDSMQTIKELAEAIQSNKEIYDAYIDEINRILETKENKDHNHDDQYAPKEHEHDLEDLHISDSFYDKTEVNNILKDYSPLVHEHEISEINKLQETLDSKANAEEVNNKFNNIITDIENDYMEAIAQAISELIDGAPDAMNTLNELAESINANKSIYDAYVKEVNAMLAKKADSDHHHDDTYAQKDHTHDATELNISDTYYNKTEIANMLKDKSDVGHDHDDVYDNKYAPIDHHHTTNEIDDFNTVLNTSIADASSKTLADANAYTEDRISEIIGLESGGNTSLSGLAYELTNHINDFEEYKNTINAALENKENKDHDHDDIYAEKEHTHVASEITDFMQQLEAYTYDKTNLDEVLKNLSPNDHTHIVAEIDDFDSAVEAKITEATDAIVNDFNEYKKDIDAILVTKEDKGHNHDDTYAPKEHEHNVEDLHLSDTYYNKTEIANMLKDKSDVGHDHDDIYDNKYSPIDHQHTTSEITDFDSVVNGRLADSAAQTLADANAYTEQEIAKIIGADGDGTSLAGLAGNLANHIEDFNTYKSEIDTALENKAPLEHTHSIGDVDGLEDLLDSKLEAIDCYTKEEMDTILATKEDTTHTHEEHYTKEETDELLKKKSDFPHYHDDRYYLQYQVDAKINNLQIGKYATLENLQAWAELLAPKTHEHENAQNFGLIDDLVLQNLLTRVYGFVYES